MKDVSQIDLIDSWGTKLKDLRESKDLSREIVAEKTLIPVRRLQRLEIQETNNIFSHELFRLCQIYQVDINTFFNEPTVKDEETFQYVFNKNPEDVSPADLDLFKLFFNEIESCKQISDEDEKNEKLKRINTLIKNFINFQK